jgi:hypothetical protein
MSRALRRRYGHVYKSRFKQGQRVEWVRSGPRYGQLGTVEHVRPDGLLIVHFDVDPPRHILVTDPNDVRGAR